MLTENDFFLKFEKYSNVELVKIKKKDSTYSHEALTALERIIDLRGGIEKLLIEDEELKTLQIETVRILLETEKLYNEQKSLETIKTLIKSTIITEVKKNEIIISEFTKLEIEEDNFDINPKSVLNIISGVLISSFIGSCLYCFQMICSEQLFYVFCVAMIFISYFNVKFFTDQKKLNSILFLAATTTFFISIFFGQLLYAYYTRIKYN